MLDAAERYETGEQILAVAIDRNVLLLRVMLRARRLHSSMIDRIAFDDTGADRVVPRIGQILCHAVPRALYDSPTKAESVGRLFNDAIRGRFRCEPDPDRRHRPD